MVVRGYTRVCGNHQDLVSEKESLQRAGASEVFTDPSPPGQTKRIAIDELMGQCSAGDLIVVLSLNRLGRSIDEILDTVAAFEKRMIYIFSIKDKFDSRTDEGGVLSSFLDALKSAKGDLSSELTKRGMQRYSETGKKIGRPTVDRQSLKEALDMIYSGLPVATAAQKTGISAPTLHRYMAKERAVRSA
jgi:DNA invertase Pin-like site-specific DNA recombinase